MTDYTYTTHGMVVVHFEEGMYTEEQVREALQFFEDMRQALTKSMEVDNEPTSNPRTAV